jgi:circadian clock protein KaiC
MRDRGKRRPAGADEFLKVPSGIQGLDEITGGWLRKGRPTLISGVPGCGKTLFAMESAFQGILPIGFDGGEP